MKLKNLYQEVIKKGIEADIRGKKTIDSLLKKRKKTYLSLSQKDKDLFDLDSLTNPFSDTRIIWGNDQDDVKSLIVGIDVEVGELALVDRLREKGQRIDLAISHHPEGRAYANFYEVMDLQVDIFAKEGIALGVGENLLKERKAQVSRRVSSANHSRSVDAARLLDINFLCMHTPCDNLAYQYLDRTLQKTKPTNLGEIMKILFDIPEYKDAARGNNPPKIVVGQEASRCQKIHLEFTGGTEGPKEIYEKLSDKGVDTIIAMHQSEEHFKKCKEANINVIFASHIASDNIGINIMLDYLESKEKLAVHEFSGFRRFKRKKGK